MAAVLGWVTRAEHAVSTPSPAATPSVNPLFCPRVTGGELFEDIVAREYYSEADAR